MHRLLLHAALDQGPTAARAWSTWKAQGGDVQAADHASGRLFALVAKNLADNGVPEPELDRLRGVRRRSWVEHTNLMRRLAPYAAALVRQGLPVLFLKGIVLAPLYYGEVGLRSFSDIDVLVKPEDVPRAVRALAAVGLRSHPSTPGTLAQATTGETNLADEGFRHGLAFVDGEGLELDLHWAVLHTHIGPESDVALWRRAVPCSIAGIDGFTLAPCDHLLHVIVHGLAYSAQPSLGWVADVLTIMRARGADIDWPAFVAEVKQRGLEPPVFEALTYLMDEFGAPLPNGVLTSFAKPWPLMARLRHSELMHEWGDVRTPWGVFAELSRHTSGRPPAAAMAVAARFFKHRIDYTRPLFAAKQLARPILLLLPRRMRSAVRAWGRTFNSSRSG